MRQIIEISQPTLKRLENYHRVVDNELQKADKAQWMDMTLERMEVYRVARQKADHIGAVTAYANFLFRVRNGMMSYRKIYGEHLLRNALLALLDELQIPVKMVDLPENETRHIDLG